MMLNRPRCRRWPASVTERVSGATRSGLDLADAPGKKRVSKQLELPVKDVGRDIAEKLTESLRRASRSCLSDGSDGNISD